MTVTPPAKADGNISEKYLFGNIQLISFSHFSFYLVLADKFP